MLLDSLTPTISSGVVAASTATAKVPLERIKHNYEEDAFRQMTVQIESWAEQQFARSDPREPMRASTSNSARNSSPTDSPPKPKPNSATPQPSIPTTPKLKI